MKKLILVMIVMYVAVPAIASAAIPDGFSTETVTGGLSLPTTFDFTSDGRILIAEKNGTVRVVKNGKLLAEPFIELQNVNTHADRGLIGLAVDSDFETNGHVYLSYTYENSPADPDGPKMAQIVRVTADGDVAAPGSMVVLAGSEVGNPDMPSCNDFATGTDCIPSDSGSHSAGGLRFGPDGKLYATLGDGASFSFVDPNAYKAQNLDWLTGKILRLNRDGTAPADNPFYTGDPNEIRSKIFAYGIRNSYRFDFRPSTGALYTGDVGWGGFEEINVVPPGVNLGWPCREGSGLQGAYQCTADDAIPPLYEYSHAEGVAAVTGGAFAGAAYPFEYQDSYFFGDFHRNEIYRMEVTGDDSSVVSIGTWHEGTAGGPVSILAGPDGSIYYIAIFSGELRRIVHQDSQTDPQPPIARDDSTTTLRGNTVYLDVLKNDSDPNGDPLTIMSVSNPLHGSVFINGDNTLTYTPESDYIGMDSFTYVVSDGTLTDTATVSIDIRENGDPSLVDAVHVSLTKNVVNPVVGEVTTFTTTVRNDGETGPFLVVFDLYDAGTGVRVDDFVHANEFIGAGETRSYEYEWIPERSGPYWLSVGYFYSDWSGMHHWEDKGLQFEVFDREPTGEPLSLSIDGITISNTAPAFGEAVHAIAAIRNNGRSGTGLVDIEVTNEAGEVVHQEFFDNEPFGEGVVREFTTTWTPTAVGTYFVDAGTFGKGWFPFMAWMWHGAEFEVGGAVPPPATTVYDDALASGWASWSWDTTIDFSETGTVESGSAAMAITYEAPWGGVYLRAADPVLVDTLTSLVLSLHGGAATGQELQIKMIDESGTILHEEPLPVLTGSWQRVSIPLSGIPSGSEIAGIFVMGRTGEVEASYFLDTVYAQ